MAETTLSEIRKKVRRLTRNLSESQLSTDQIDNYINTFVLYDFPEHLRLFNLKETFSFYTTPYVDVYETSTNAASPLFDFKNKYLTVHEPVYIAGRRARFFQDRNQFFSLYPSVSSIKSIGSTGNGVLLTFTGFVGSISGNSNTLLRNNVLFDSIDAAGNGMPLVDYPISATIGNLYVPGGAPTDTAAQDAANYINYTTGQFVITFTAAPGSGEAINSQTVIVPPSLPTSMLYFDGKFTLRPVPDHSYKVNVEVFVRPTELLADDQDLKLQEWWQFIAYGAARKVFQDRMDMESLGIIETEYKKQENLILRRTIVQQTDQRVTTIFVDRSGTGHWDSSY